MKTARLPVISLLALISSASTFLFTWIFIGDIFSTHIQNQRALGLDFSPLDYTLPKKKVGSQAATTGVLLIRSRF
jgi:hypothetical protein